MDGLPQAAIWGLGKVVAQEFPELRCVRVDLEPEGGFEGLLAELTQPGEEPQVAYRGGRRYVARLARIGRTRKPPRKNGRAGGCHLPGQRRINGLGLAVGGTAPSSAVPATSCCLAAAPRRLKQSGARHGVVLVGRGAQVASIVAKAKCRRSHRECASALVYLERPPLRSLPTPFGRRGDPCGRPATGAKEDGVLMHQNCGALCPGARPEGRGCLAAAPIYRGSSARFLCLVLFRGRAPWRAGAGEFMPPPMRSSTRLRTTAAPAGCRPWASPGRFGRHRLPPPG